jgi:hypothetical protein
MFKLLFLYFNRNWSQKNNKVSKKEINCKKKFKNLPVNRYKNEPKIFAFFSLDVND